MRLKGFIGGTQEYVYNLTNYITEIFVISGRRNTYRPREIKMRMIRFGKRDDSKYLTSLANNDSTSLNHTKRDFWLPSGFWWPKDSSHQKFVKFLYLFKKHSSRRNGKEEEGQITG